MRIDRVDVKCKRCKRERVFVPEKIMTDMVEVSRFLDGTVGPCDQCAYEEAEVRLRDRDPQPTQPS